MTTEMDRRSREEAIALEAARKAAKEVMRETFRMFGVDPDDQDSVNEFRADLIYMRDLRKMSRNVWGKVVLILVTGCLTWIVATFGAGVKAKLGM